MPPEREFSSNRFSANLQFTTMRLICNEPLINESVNTFQQIMGKKIRFNACLFIWSIYSYQQAKVPDETNDHSSWIQNFAESCFQSPQQVPPMVWIKSIAQLRCATVGSALPNRIQSLRKDSQTSTQADLARQAIKVMMTPSSLLNRTRL